MQELPETIDEAVDTATDVLMRPDFYLQIGITILTVVVAWLISEAVRKRLRISPDPEKTGIKAKVSEAAFYVRELLFPATSAILLGITVALSGGFFDQKWLVQLAQGINLLILVHRIAFRITISHYVRNFLLFIIAPIVVLYAIGALHDVITALDDIRFELGSIDFSLYALTRTLIFGTALFWLGRVSSRTGQDVIRRKMTQDHTMREITLKGFQIVLFVMLALVFLQVAGIDLTALVVFGGAIGVGLGFGLQQIASNFISGIIILLDRSLTIGDYIELEDGRAGTLRELSMRSATLETFDGKDIMVPNERFITTAFTNWTHNNQKQRYPIVLSVAYGTDLEKLFQILRETVASHPQVLSSDDLPVEERPDAEVQAFGDNGIEILVEFWMEGVDDGKNRVGGDLRLMIWSALKQNGIEIPFPQREVTLLPPKAGAPTTFPRKS